MRNGLIILLAIMAFSCSNNKIPKGILTEDEITPILVELHLAEAIYNQRYALNVTRESYQEDLYLSIIKKYKIDRKVLEASILYYGKHPDKYKPVYDEVLNRLNEMNVKSRAKDSIANRTPTAKAIVKDTVQTKKTETNGVVKDSIPSNKTDVNNKIKDSLQAIKAKSIVKEPIVPKKIMTKGVIKDLTPLEKTGVKGSTKDAIPVKK